MRKTHPDQRNLLDTLDEEPPPVARPDGVIVRETTCKTILNSWASGGYSLNCYTGCSHSCAYCYARFMQRFHPHTEPWGQFVDVKTNAVEVLERQLRRATPGSVFVSSACDGWQPLEAERELTRECCRLLIRHGFTVDALTKSELILRDLDVLAGGRAHVGVTLVTLDEHLRALWEPRAGTVTQRLGVVTKAHEAGLPTRVACGPLLPYLSDSREAIEALFRELAEREVDQIWVDPLNPRPRVWESVSTLLGEHFPDLVSRYRAILFDAATREAYVEEVRNRARAAAERLGLVDRVAV